MEVNDGVMPKENVVNEIEKIRLERERWEIEKRREEEAKLKAEEEKRLVEEREKEMRSSKGKNAIIGLLLTTLSVIVIIFLITNYTSGIREELEDKSVQLDEQNKTIELQNQIDVAYAKGVNDASVAIMSRMITSLNTNGFVEMELPIGMNQTQIFRLGIIQ